MIADIKQQSQNMGEQFGTDEIKNCPRCHSPMHFYTGKGFGWKCQNCLFSLNASYQESYAGNINKTHRMRSIQQDERVTSFSQWLRSCGIGEGTINTYVSGVKKYLEFLDGGKTTSAKSISATEQFNKNHSDNTQDPYPNSKIGSIVQTVLCTRLSYGLPEDELHDLQGLQQSKSLFHLNYPLLSTNRDEDNKTRYYKNPVQINGRKFYICSQWFETPANNDRPYLIQWLKNHPIPK